MGYVDCGRDGQVYVSALVERQLRLVASAWYGKGAEAWLPETTAAIAAVALQSWAAKRSRSGDYLADTERRAEKASLVGLQREEDSCSDDGHARSG